MSSTVSQPNGVSAQVPWLASQVHQHIQARWLLTLHVSDYARRTACLDEAESSSGRTEVVLQPPDSEANAKQGVHRL